MGSQAPPLGQPAPLPAYGMLFPFAPMNMMPQFPMTQMYQNTPWKGQGKTPSRSSSPGPSKDLNSQQTLGTDATLSPSLQPVWKFCHGPKRAQAWQK